ncbi:MAG: diaminopimelate decarboxylase [Gammaproteobacteria bacterium]|nr:diaminopimelate decarboxylase [Gammaproteobacteria bacterium]
MDHFKPRDGVLHAEDVDLVDLAARYGTPCYVYSRATIERHWRAYDEALAGMDHLVCYAVKANSNLAVLDLLARLGSGFDIVSGGELSRVLAVGAPAERIVFSGVGKTASEMRQGLAAGIGCFNVESRAELVRLDGVATQMGLRAPISVRVNPDVDPGTHPYIATGLRESKFGVPMEEALALYLEAAAMPGIQPVGVDCHIGSQLVSTAPFVAALERVLALVDRLAEDGIAVEHLDVGGGLGIGYQDERPPTPATLVEALRPRLAGRRLRLLMEPGRSIAGNAGLLLTRVEYLKSHGDHHFAVVDAAMNDLARPSLYGAWQAIEPVVPRSSAVRFYDVVGPVCETGDFLGKGRSLALAPGDLLAVRGAGAYGFTMGSNYNSRPRPPEVMVDGPRTHLVRPREEVTHLFATETTLPAD